MERNSSGRYDTIVTAGEEIQAFVPDPLPPLPALDLSGGRQQLPAQPRNLTTNNQPTLPAVAEEGWLNCLDNSLALGRAGQTSWRNRACGRVPSSS
jgi:hypothetical protein